MTFHAAVTSTLRPPLRRPAKAPGRARRCPIAVMALLLLLSTGLSRADAVEMPPTLEPDTGSQGTDTLPAGLQLNQPAPAAQASLASRWWFWTAMGAVAVATATVIVASSRGSGPPSTHLGNQVFGQ